MEPYFADQCRTLTEKIRALREPDDLCFALLAGTALSDFADHTDENIRAVDAQTHFDGVIHLGDILNGSIPENASRFVLSQELARFQNATASGKLYIACGDDDGFRNERYVGQIVTGIVTDERWYQETAYLEQYPDLHRPQNRPYYYVDFSERKARLKAINEELSLTAVKFGQNLLAENNNYALELASSDLDGIPATARDLAREKAEAMGRKGKYVFTLHKPSLIPFLTYSSKRELREQIYKAYLNRCNNGDEYDNKQLINDFIRLRTEKAHLLGYPSYAAYVVDDEMAGTTDAVYGLLEEIWTPALESAKGELAEMEELFRKDFPEGEFASWDWWYYAEKVRKQKYALDEEMLRPYFSLENVQGGIFFLANRLYGITFRPIVVPLYHPEAVAYEVLDVDQSHLGVLYFDYFPRDGKSQGAWCGNYVEQTYEDGKRVAPVVSVVCNFTRPAGGNPALLTLDETETLFHEFGHALHFLFHDVKYRGLAEVEGDFVELPSQLMENWAFDPEVLKQYAVHYRSNEVIPKYLVDKLRRSELFNQGFMATELIAASLSDMDIHSITEYEPFDPMAFERKALTEKRGLIPQIEPRYRYPYFSHIFDGGYSAGYYFYTWAEVLDKDAFEAFRESGDLFNKKIAGDFRRKILARGGSEDGMTMYRDFRGKDPDKRAMLRGRGLLNEPEPSGEDAAPAAETASAAREN